MSQLLFLIIQLYATDNLLNALLLDGYIGVPVLVNCEGENQGKEAEAMMLGYRYRRTNLELLKPTFSSEQPYTRIQCQESALNAAKCIETLLIMIFRKKIHSSYLILNMRENDICGL